MITAGRLAAVRAAAAPADPTIVRWEERPASHRVENMTTNSLVHHRVALDDGSTLDLFAKTLHPASCSPGWAEIPEFARAQVLQDLHWLDEPRLYRCGLAADLPGGLRFPRLFHVEEGTDRLTLWL